MYKTTLLLAAVVLAVEAQHSVPVAAPVPVASYDAYMRHQMAARHHEAQFMQFVTREFSAVP